MLRLEHIPHGFRTIGIHDRQLYTRYGKLGEHVTHAGEQGDLCAVLLREHPCVARNHGQLPWGHQGTE
jgi:hypothetical protein